MSSPEVERSIATAVSTVETVLRDGAPHQVDAGTVQLLFGAAVKLYAAKRELDEDFAPLRVDVAVPMHVTATEGVIAASAILRAIDVEVFELGMWRSWGTA